MKILNSFFCVKKEFPFLIKLSNQLLNKKRIRIFSII